MRRAWCELVDGRGVRDVRGHVGLALRDERREGRKDTRRDASAAAPARRHEAQDREARGALGASIAIQLSPAGSNRQPMASRSAQICSF